MRISKIISLFLALIIFIASCLTLFLSVADKIVFPGIFVIALLYILAICSALYILISTPKFILDAILFEEVETRKVSVKEITQIREEIVSIAKQKGIDLDRLNFHCLYFTDGKSIEELDLTEIIHFRSYILSQNNLISKECRNNQVYG